MPAGEEMHPRPLVYFTDSTRTEVAADFSEYDMMFDDLHKHFGPFRSWRFPAPKGATIEAGSRHTIPDSLLWSFPGPNGSVFQQPVFTGPPYNSTLTSEFERLFRLIYGRVAEHLDSKGLLNHTYAVVVDEPIWRNPTLRNAIAMMKLYRSLGIRIWQTRFPIPFKPEVYPLVDQWCTHVSQYMTHGAAEEMAKLRRQGKIITMYNNGVPITDMPTMRVRSFPWALWATNSGHGRWEPLAGDGLMGSLDWYQVNAWWPHRDPWVTPEAFRNIAGWGYLLYPPYRGPVIPSAETDPLPLVNSIRWEMFAQGLEDAEYFALLQRLGGNASSVLERVLEVAWSFTQQWSSEPPFEDDGYSTNITLLHEVKNTIADAIESLMTSTADIV